MQKYTVVSMGEPAGNSPEMIIRAVRNLAGDPSVWLIVTGDEGVFRKAAADFSLPLPFTYYADDEESSEDDIMAERIIRWAPPITAIVCALIIAVSLVYHFVIA